MRPFVKGHHRPYKDNQKSKKRSLQQLRMKRSAKLREYYGVRNTKKILRSALLNVDGLDEVSLEDVKATVSTKQPDVLILLETKRRMEACDTVADIPGYSLYEAKRSDAAGDKEGGGIALYTRLSDGLIFKHHTPDIDEENETFVNNERVWVTVQTQSSKTAICGVYVGCQYSDDRNGVWNDTIYRVLQREAYSLRSKGYRVIFLGDFNGHIGCEPGRGVQGNNADVNANGQRFLDFLTITDSMHINGDRTLTTGLWTRQRAGHSSVIDFATISSEHKNTALSLYIDDTGDLGGGSDHNWLIFDVSDNFVKLKRKPNIAVKKTRWNILDNQDWSGFKKHCEQLAPTIICTSVDSLAHGISTSILSALHTYIGVKSSLSRSTPRLLPKHLVDELKVKRSLEKNWKSLNRSHKNSDPEVVAVAEQLFTSQKLKVSDLLHLHKQHRRSSIIEQCKGHSFRARKNFWSYVSPSKKQSAVISAVVDPTSGAVKCNNDGIIAVTEGHLITTFQGSYNPIQPEPPEPPAPTASDHSYVQPPEADPAAVTRQGLVNLDTDKSLNTNPTGWLNTPFEVKEIKAALDKLENGKARGWDNIPNEALKNLPENMISKITELFNLIKTSGTMPHGWNRGRVTLIHKRGLREQLSNYRPLTVIISLCGLYSRVLNERLISVVEQHDLLGEIQNGFRKNRCTGDNSFVLDTILWKARAMKKKVHLGFLDISKAYDTVNRSILWKKLHSLGIKGDFLATLMSIYKDDSIDCMINGALTRPIFLRRGLRQGCSLSPLLFALYISDVGIDIHSSELGFAVGNTCVTGLLFADDIVLISKSAAGLQRLLTIVKKRFDLLKLTISHDKSQIISPDDAAWDLFDRNHNVEMSLLQVSQYKYLGTWTFGGMYRTGNEKQKLSVKTATKYKNCCIYVSKMGPDVVDVVLCTWQNVAIPAILSGCEVIPFSETKIQEIERIQSQVAKFALGVPITFPNVSCQSELGLKPFKQLLYERQLKFFFRLLYLGTARWSHQALLDHMSGAWDSPYMSYIYKIRSELGIFSASNIPSFWKKTSSNHFLNKSNTVLASYFCVEQLSSLSRAPYICENELSTIITQFKFDHADLGNNAPRPGYHRKLFCPLCPVLHRTSCFHLLFVCDSIKHLRVSTGIQGFINSALVKNLSLEDAFKLFVNGLDCQGKPVLINNYLERAKCMSDMRLQWLSMW